MRNNQFILLVKYPLIIGNIILLFWFSFNRISEEFKGSIYQKISSVGLIGLLIITILSIFLINKQQISFLRYIAGAGNALFLLWILFNGIMAGFKAPLPEIFYYVGVMALLALNSLLLITIRTKLSAEPRIETLLTGIKKDN